MPQLSRGATTDGTKMEFYGPSMHLQTRKMSLLYHGLGHHCRPPCQQLAVTPAIRPIDQRGHHLRLKW